VNRNFQYTLKLRISQSPLSVSLVNGYYPSAVGFVNPLEWGPQTGRTR